MALRRPPCRGPRAFPAGQIHPTVDNPLHADHPHYDLRFSDGTKAAIIVVGGG